MTEMNDRAKSIRSLLAAIVCHALWGLSFVASRTALSTAHMFVLLSHRFLLAFLVMNLLLLFRLARVRLQGKRVFLVILLGVAVVGFVVVQTVIRRSPFAGVLAKDDRFPVVSLYVAIARDFQKRNAT